MDKSKMVPSMKTIKFQVFAVILLLMTTAMWVSGQSFDPVTTLKRRNMCPPGYFMSFSRSEVTCEPCPNGTYQGLYNRLQKCNPHKTCSKPREVFVSKGNSTANTECQCENGTERIYRGRLIDLNYNCTPCPPGTVSKLLPDSSQIEPGDTICCPPEQIAGSTLLQRLCVRPRTDSNSTLLTTTAVPTTVNSSSVENTSDKPPTYSSGKIGEIAAGVVIALLVAVTVGLACAISYGIKHPDTCWGKCVPSCMGPDRAGRAVQFRRTHNGEAVVQL